MTNSEFQKFAQNILRKYQNLLDSSQISWDFATNISEIFRNHLMMNGAQMNSTVASVKWSYVACSKLRFSRVQWKMIRDSCRLSFRSTPIREYLRVPYWLLFNVCPAIYAFPLSIEMKASLGISSVPLAFRGRPFLNQYQVLFREGRRCRPGSKWSARRSHPLSSICSQ